MELFCLELLVHQYASAMRHLSRGKLYIRTHEYVGRILRALQQEQWHKDNAWLVDCVIVMEVF